MESLIAPALPFIKLYVGSDVNIKQKRGKWLKVDSGMSILILWKIHILSRQYAKCIDCG